MIEDIGFIFIYLGTFGMSDMVVDYFRLKGLYKILYYLFFILLGLVIIFYLKKNKKDKLRQPLL